jgi:hypothetical protein
MAPSKTGKLSISQKILNATASLAGKPNVKVCRKTVAKRCGFASEPKVYVNALGIMKNKKLQIIYDKESITILDAGFKLADPAAPIGSNADALREAQEKFKSRKQKQILEICSDGQVHTKVEIGEKIGSDPDKRSFGNLFGPLRTQGFIDFVKTENGEPAVKGTEELIPFGIPSSV